MISEKAACAAAVTAQDYSLPLQVILTVILIHLVVTLSPKGQVLVNKSIDIDGATRWLYSGIYWLSVVGITSLSLIAIWRFL